MRLGVSILSRLGWRGTRAGSGLQLWITNPNNPILGLGDAKQWDGEFASWATVVHVAPAEWRMYYSGKDALGQLRIGLALSSDGANWRKYEGNPILDTGKSGDWDAQYVYAPVVWRDQDSWRMLFTGCDSSQHDNYQIGVAESEDGVQWTKCARNPVFCNPDAEFTNRHGYQETEGWGLVADESGYTLLYNTVTRKPRQIYLARSSNLISWQPLSKKPLIPSQGRPTDLGYMKYCAWPFMSGKQIFIFVATSDETYSKSGLGLWQTKVLSSDEEPRLLGYALYASKGWCEMELDSPFVIGDEIAGSLRLYFGGRSKSNHWTEGLAIGRLDVTD
jgi:hypothetical protein